MKDRVILYYRRYKTIQSSIFGSIMEATLEALRLLEYEQGYPYEIVNDKGETVWKDDQKGKGFDTLGNLIKYENAKKEVTFGQHKRNSND